MSPKIASKMPLGPWMQSCQGWLLVDGCPSTVAIFLVMGPIYPLVHKLLPRCLPLPSMPLYFHGQQWLWVCTVCVNLEPRFSPVSWCFRLIFLAYACTGGGSLQFTDVWNFKVILGGLHTWPVDLRGEGIQQCDWWRAERLTFGPPH